MLNCACCAFPVVDGIPYMRTGPAADAAMHALGRGDRDAALRAALELGAAPWRALQRLLRRPGRQATFAEASAILLTEGERPYVLHRFSDPTHLRARSLLRAALARLPGRSPVVLDLCGGAGHLAYAAARFSKSAVVLADLAFRKLWLAKRFVVPEGRVSAVCCDANLPLPFARGAFDLAHCSDAFHYVWHKRLLAEELTRLIAGLRRGTILLSHVHNALSWNWSAGMPIAPAHLRALFDHDGLDVRVVEEASIPLDLPGRSTVDLSSPRPPGTLAKSPALALLASRDRLLFRRHELATPRPRAGRLNPLYRRDGDARTVALSLPTPAYEAEYAEIRRYLPDVVDARPVPAAARLDLPKRYA